MKKAEENSPELGTRLEAAGLFILFLHLSFRFAVATDLTNAAVDLFIHGLVWIGAAMWLVGRAMSGGAVIRWTGIEISFFVWIVLCIASVLRASYRLPAIEHAFVFSTLPVLFCFVVSAVGLRYRGLLLQFIYSFAFLVGVYAILQIVWILPHDRALLMEQVGAGNLDPRFLIRLQSNEVWGTFVYPNTFAGFLVLVIPILAGALIDARKNGAPGMLMLAKTAGLGVCLAALFLTGSRGGWVAFVVAALAFGGLLIAKRSDRARKLVYGAGVAAFLLIGVLVAAGPLGPGNLGEHMKSMWVRSVYWEAAMNTVKQSPMLGVGLDNYQEYYPEFKPPEQTDTKKAHNDYLQILAELGIVGLLAFLSILFFFGRAALFSTQESLPPPERGWGPSIIVVPVALGIGLGYFLTGAFNDIGSEGKPGPILAIVVAAIWIGYLLVTWRSESEQLEKPCHFLRIGAAAGFVGLCVHMFVDYDMYDFGTATALFTVAALIVILQRKPVEIHLGPTAAGISAGVLMIIVLPFITMLTPTLMQAESAGIAARRALADGKYSRAEAILEHAMLSNSLDARLPQIRAQLYLRQLRDLKIEPASGPQLALFEALAGKAIEDELFVRTRSFAAWYRKAKLYLNLRRAYNKLSRVARHPRGRWRAQANSSLVQAQNAVAKAIQLYPANAHFRYLMATIYDLRRMDEQALAEYRTASKYSARARQVDSVAQPHLALPPYEEAVAYARLGQEDEAVKYLTLFVRGMVTQHVNQSGQPRTRELFEELLKEMGAKPLEYLHEEFHSVLKNALKRVIDLLIKEVRGLENN